MINKSALLAEKILAKRSKKQEIVLDPNFPKQNQFVLDTSRFIAAQCSRRAGKTNGLALRFFRTMEKHPGSQCLYLALTRESAEEIMWPVLLEFNEKYNLGCTFTQSKLTMKHPNGSTLKIMGADMKNFIKRIKGRKYPGIAIDEAQDFGPHLQSLIDDVLTPSTSDYEDGWLAVTGTPGPVPVGYFFDVTELKRFGFSRHDWTLLENPHMPDPQGFIATLMAQREWDENHPTLLREYRNRWVKDTKSLWIQYSESKCHFTQLEPAKWQYILGVDLGYKDADALAVLAYNDDSPRVYLVHEDITPKQGITELATKIKQLDAKYHFNKKMVDAGALGKKIVEELTRRHGVHLQAAEKQQKQENVEWLNDAMRRGLFMAKSDSQFVKDSYLIQIDWDKSTPDKIVIKKNYHSDIIDAVLYAFKVSPAYAYQAPVPKPPEGSQAHYDAITAQLEEQAEEYFLELERQQNGGFDDGFS